MKNKLSLVCLPLLIVCSAVRATEPPGDSQVVFHEFTYEGHNPFYEESAPQGTFYNPILPGFYPDPSITRVGEDYYLVNSTFAWFPGVPIFHSRDLVNWEQLGHVLDRPSQLDLDGMGVSEGVFAPTIEYHAGAFYMITTLVNGGGNFFVTASDPKGPWSDPIWLPEVDGIDPSFFFDDDGRAWIVNNGPPPNAEPLYEGHRAIWIQEFDPDKQATVGPRRILVNGGVDLSEKPIWIEGPHLFKRGGWYYLTCAEGGTAEDHRQVVFRSRSLDGPFEPWNGNPILTQRNLDPGRPNPVTCTGHADLVRTAEGEWWAVFLGCRPYEGNYYNTGRETFLLPVTWTKDGWPRILEKGEAVPLVVPLPAGAPKPISGEAMDRGNFTWKDDFANEVLDPAWAMLRTPREQWWQVGGESESLRLRARQVPLTGKEQPSFLARRQQHAYFTATTRLEVPTTAGVEAGLVTFLDGKHYFFIGVRKGAQACEEVFLERADGDVDTLIERPLKEGDTVFLRIAAEGRPYTFSWSIDGQNWHTLKELDGSILSIAHAWNFTGTMIGPYARRISEEP